jgi:hypothetical protein
LPKVFSSHVDEIDHDPASGALTVRWKTGKVSVYKDVPEKVAGEVMRSASIGEALRQNVRGRYDHAYLEDVA